MKSSEVQMITIGKCVARFNSDTALDVNFVLMAQIFETERQVGEFKLGASLGTAV